MSSMPLNLALGRVLVAAAWADGQLDETERSALETLLFRLPSLEPSEWKELATDLERSSAPTDFEARLEALRGAVTEPQQREVARQRVEQLHSAWSGPEAEALGQVLDQLETETPRSAGGLFGRLRASIAQPLRERAQRVQEHFQSEQALESGLRSRVEAAWPAGEALPDEAELHHMCVGAAILAHVVHLDDEVDDGEVIAMRNALIEHWGIGEAAAAATVDTVLEAGRLGFDLYSLLREFFENSEEPERQRFLAAVFHVAAGDGKATYDEIEEVRRIGRGLLLSHRHFIAAKLQLPEDERET